MMKSHHVLIAVSTEHARVPGRATRLRHTSQALLAGLLAVVWSLASPSMASASLLSHEAEDAVANFVAIFVLFVIPVVLITLFWMVHVLPEKIAHKRHHPQLEGIRTLCFLSLVFGGLLWPMAWLWAYTKPVGYKLATEPTSIPTTSRSTGTRSRTAPTADIRQRVPRSKSAACRPVSSTRFAPIWQR